MQNQPITVLLEAARRGDGGATDELFTAVYGELRKLARSNRRRWRGNQTMNTTALIHETYLRLSGEDKLNLQNRTHFYATASKAMRQILFNYAEKASAQKRGGKAADVPLQDDMAFSTETAEELIELTEYLQLLEKDSPRRCRVVECRVFAGMSVKETAEALGIAPATVKRDWQVASATLRRNMREIGESDAPDSH